MDCPACDASRSPHHSRLERVDHVEHYLVLFDRRHPIVQVAAVEGNGQILSLVLAGHTHGGQVNLPIIGPPVVPSRFGSKYASGLFQRGDTYLYVSRGVGMISPGVRFNCRPEIALFHMHCA